VGGIFRKLAFQKEGWNLLWDVAHKLANTMTSDQNLVACHSSRQNMKRGPPEGCIQGGRSDLSQQNVALGQSCTACLSGVVPDLPLLFAIVAL
jgi:hypothetical protein